jgi:uncharacterized protein
LRLSMSNSSKSWLAIGLVAGIAGTIFVQRQREVKRLGWQAARGQNSPGWALVTGASSGIGAAFARRLARDGYSLVLVARRAERLQALADDIRAAAGPGVEIAVLPADLDQPGDLQRVEQRLGQEPGISLLVNNAGFGAGGPFASADLQRQQAMIRVHVLASVRLARAALPGMLARRHGALINVSSMGGFIPMPGSVNYAATKAYLNNFSEGLSLELQGSGVRVQALCPGMTRSEFHSVSHSDISAIPAAAWMTAEEVVDESLLGLREDRVIVVPGLLNRLLYAIVTIPWMGPLIRLVLRLVQHRLPLPN